MTAAIYYITCSNITEAEKISKQLLNEKLIACANIIEDMKSMYWWSEEIENENEVILILKSKLSLAEKIENKINSIHSYDCPCIVWYEIKGSRKYMEWIDTNTV